MTVQFHSIQHLSAASGKLSILFDKGTLVLDLGALASKWEHKIRNPKSLLDKLGVKLGMKVGVQGVRDTGFLKEPALHLSKSYSFNNLDDHSWIVQNFTKIKSLDCTS